MSRRLTIGVLVALAVGLLLPAEARAQFETPNRSFHNATGFRLEGRHAAVPCESCHLNKQFKGTPNTCFACHWVRRKDDRYQTRLGTECGQCHRPMSWTAVNWNHAAQAGVRLNASHQTLPCMTCHKNGFFKSVALQCVSCHQKDYGTTKNPNHQAAGFPVTCDRCHLPGESTWRSMGGGGFNHNSIFQLVGTHATLQCQTCHKNNVYRGTPRDCVGCHQTDYNRTQNPNHAAAGFPTTCEICHRPTDAQFRGSTGGFNHNSIFQLVGTHATLQCQSCHRNSVYRGTPRDCVGCHQADYNRTQNPNHAAAGFPTSCETCHRPTDAQFSGSTGGFNHNSIFQLVGTHATLACQSCHKNSVYRGTPRDCVGCHQADYNKTQNPNHAAAGFPTTCETCHRPTDAQFRGSGGGFNHNSIFQLQGMHATQPCAACHKNNVYRGTPRDCIGCHQANYNATRSPSHAAAGFPTTCDSCHKPSDAQWTGGSFNHNGVFPLVGVHASQACAVCHKTVQYKGTPRDCVGCHQANYNATKNPSHAAAGFPTACDSCHKPTDALWTGGSFNHNATFPLVGVHASQACAACHKNNLYRGTPRDCVGCHQANYNATANPSHPAAGFPTTCDTCHKPTAATWAPASFNHTFPRVGVHNVACQQCHTTPNNFAVYNCLACHERKRMDDKHKSMNGYRYDSVACYACHPTGRKQ